MKQSQEIKQNSTGQENFENVFASFLTTSTKFLLAKRRLGTKLCLLPFLSYSQYFLIS